MLRTKTSRRQRTIAALSPAWLVCAALACWIATVGCSQARRDRLAHFFFEIPDAAESKTADAMPVASTGELAALPAYHRPALTPAPPRFASTHPPFTQRQCAQCHDAAQRMQPREDMLDSCRVCHARHFSDEVGHAPVLQGECFECHNPHQSKQLSLLNAPANELCIDCHDEADELSELAHGVDGADQCMVCHDPHFGTGMMLRPGVETPDEETD